MNCPKCKSKLVQNQSFSVCPQGHGVVLKIEGFKKETSLSFSQFFWTKWISIRNKKTIPCPNCGLRMVQLAANAEHPVELDCCVGCFAIWLDEGEPHQLKKIFNNREQRSTVTDDQWTELGKSVLEQDESIERFERLADLGKTLNMNVHPLRRFLFYPYTN